MFKLSFAKLIDLGSTSKTLRVARFSRFNVNLCSIAKLTYPTTSYSIDSFERGSKHLFANSYYNGVSSALVLELESGITGVL